jgi:hypothetical protein
MRKLTIAVISLLFLIVINGCNKLNTKPHTEKLTETNGMALSSSYCYSCGIIDSMPSIDYGGDSIERPTILGMQHVNPYLLPNVQKAYNNLGLSYITATVNNLYVRFLPNSPQQMGILDSVMDAQGLDLFEAPMDYDILQEGDYYQDPSIPIEQVTYQYAVVPPNFVFPSGIAYTTLAQIHIPDDNYTAVETEAERLSDIQDSLNATGGGGLAAKIIPDVPQCGPNCYWDYTQLKCVCCPAGYTSNGTGCVPICQPGYYWNGSNCVPLPPPPSSKDAAIPSGYITVTDFNLSYPNLNSPVTPGVRTVRIVAKRWFKIQRMFTDNNGHFTATKRFKHKVKIVVKFRNNYADVKGLRGIRLWQMFLAIQRTVGVYSGNKSNILYNFQQRYANGTGYAVNKGNQAWAAATIVNAIQEHRDYANQFGFTPPPLGLRILTGGIQSNAGNGSAPLFGVRSDFQQITDAFSTVFLFGTNTSFPGGYTNALLICSGMHLDLTINYATPSNLFFSDDIVKEVVYHELSHASHYVHAGFTLYTNFVNAELNEEYLHRSDSYSPYGPGTDGNSPLIALGECWAYHMGFFLANQKYNVEPTAPKGDPQVFVQSGNLNTGPDAFSLENFNPNLSSDPFHWIPKGIMLDLMDNTPTENTVNDQVQGYTIQQIFGALQSDVGSVSQYKVRLLLLYGNAQQTQVNNLFASYNY